MEVVIESDSDELVVSVDMAIDNKQAIDNNDLIEMLSELDSYELLDMVIDDVPSSAASSSAAPSQPPIISIPRYLDGTQLTCSRSLGALCRPLPREGGSARALSTSRLARTCRSWNMKTTKFWNMKTTEESFLAMVSKLALAQEAKPAGMRSSVQLLRMWLTSVPSWSR